MFATLLGPLPSGAIIEGGSPEAALDAALQLQLEHGLEPLSVAGWTHPSGDPVATWRAAAARTDVLVKAELCGPWSSQGPEATAGATYAGLDTNVAATRANVLALIDSGCRWIEIHEPSAASIGTDAEARTRFADAHTALTDGLTSTTPGLHLGLAIVGGSADAVGIDVILAGTYASLAVDLIDGPDNWRLVTEAPADCGIVCGVIATRAGSDDRPELPIWAANYAASTRGRGMDRVGLATSGSLAALPWQAAALKVQRLGEAARLAAAPRAELLPRLDPRAVDIRSAALGRYDPPGDRPTRRRSS
ncbi:MAG: hypothetical protein H0U58_00125 [Chloroflexi bacterium]|nr:hypothetical protein [Chloroflexota bacterium]